MLDAIVALVVVLLVMAGILVILGPRNVWRRVSSLRRPRPPRPFGWWGYRGGVTPLQRAGGRATR